MLGTGAGWEQKWWLYWPSGQSSSDRRLSWRSASLEQRILTLLPVRIFPDVTAQVLAQRSPLTIKRMPFCLGVNQPGANAIEKKLDYYCDIQQFEIIKRNDIIYQDKT